MTTQLSTMTTLRQYLPAQQKTKFLARWISHLLSPPVVGVVAALLCAFTIDTARGWWWTAVYLSSAALLPTLYLCWLFKSGAVSDLHLNKREERIKPTIMMIIGAFIALVCLTLGNASPILRLLAAVQFCQSIIFLLITFRWKISAHTSSIATLLALSWLVIASKALIIFLPILLIVAWARVHLKRHSVSQTVAGALLGVTMLNLMLFFIVV